MINVSDLNNTQLARLILRQLWQDYDAGGISVGRSPEALLLEAVMGIIPLPAIGQLDDLSGSELLLEAQNRIYGHGRQLRLWSDNLKIIDSNLLALMLLKHLLVLYKQNRDHKDHLSDFHEVLINLAVNLLAGDEQWDDFSYFTAHDLLIEADYRYLQILKDDFVPENLTATFI